MYSENKKHSLIVHQITSYVFNALILRAIKESVKVAIYSSSIA